MGGRFCSIAWFKWPTVRPNSIERPSYFERTICREAASHLLWFKCLKNQTCAVNWWEILWIKVLIPMHLNASGAGSHARESNLCCKREAGHSEKSFWAIEVSPPFELLCSRIEIAPLPKWITILPCEILLDNQGKAIQREHSESFAK